MSLNNVAISRRCPPRSIASTSLASRLARLGEKYREREAWARSASACRRRASRKTSMCRMVLRMVFSRSRKSMGLARKSNAPRFLAVRILVMSLGGDDDGRELFFVLLQLLEE